MGVAIGACFGVIQNNIALKHTSSSKRLCHSFGVIQNNIALKRFIFCVAVPPSFGVIQNNIALKHVAHRRFYQLGFGVIQNNIALKPQMQKMAQWFRNRATNSSKIFAFYDSEELFKYSK